MSCWAVSDDTGRAATEAEREKAVVAADNTPGISAIDGQMEVLKDPDKIYPGQVLRTPPLNSWGEGRTR